MPTPLHVWSPQPRPQHQSPPNDTPRRTTGTPQRTTRPAPNSTPAASSCPFAAAPTAGLHTPAPGHRHTPAVAAAAGSPRAAAPPPWWGSLAAAHPRRSRPVAAAAGSPAAGSRPAAAAAGSQRGGAGTRRARSGTRSLRRRPTRLPVGPLGSLCPFPVWREKKPRRRGNKGKGQERGSKGCGVHQSTTFGRSRVVRRLARKSNNGKNQFRKTISQQIGSRRHGGVRARNRHGTAPHRRVPPAHPHPPP